MPEAMRLQGCRHGRSLDAEAASCFYQSCIVSGRLIPAVGIHGRRMSHTPPQTGNLVQSRAIDQRMQ
jgi:1,6-anhydro-N-acetylmuramate kinase